MRFCIFLSIIRPSRVEISPSVMNISPGKYSIWVRYIFQRCICAGCNKFYIRINLLGKLLDSNRTAGVSSKISKPTRRQEKINENCRANIFTCTFSRSRCNKVYLSMKHLTMTVSRNEESSSEKLHQLVKIRGSIGTLVKVNFVFLIAHLLYHDPSCISEFYRSRLNSSQFETAGLIYQCPVDLHAIRMAIDVASVLLYSFSMR